MGKILVCVAATACLCFTVYHFAPSTMGVAFNAKGLDVTWMAMIALGGLFVSHRIVSGK